MIAGSAARRSFSLSIACVDRRPLSDKRLGRAMKLAIPLPASIQIATRVRCHTRACNINRPRTYLTIA